MESEALYIALLIAPWALALIAWLFYRRRQLRRTRNSSGAGGKDANKRGI